MQLDSDIVVKKNTIELLYKFIKEKNVSVSGYIFNTNKTTIKKDFLNKYFNYLLFHGEIQPKPGTISQLGIPFSFGNNDFKEEITELIGYKVELYYTKKRTLFLKIILNFLVLHIVRTFFTHFYLEKKLGYIYTKMQFAFITIIQCLKYVYKFLNEYKIRLKLFKILNNKMYIRFNLWFLFYMVKTNLNFLLKNTKCHKR